MSARALCRTLGIEKRHLHVDACPKHGGIEKRQLHVDACRAAFAIQQCCSAVAGVLVCGWLLLLLWFVVGCCWCCGLLLVLRKQGSHIACAANIAGDLAIAHLTVHL